MLVQSFIISKSDFLYSGLPFTDGVPLSASFVVINRYLLNWYFPVIAISFYISGFMGESLSKYGKLLIVRNYSKTLWILKEFQWLALNLLLFVVVQFLIFWFGPFPESSNSFWDVSRLILMYYLTLFTLFCIQLLLELFMSQQISLLILNSYIIISIILSSSLPSTKFVAALNYMFLPNFGMGFRNGLNSIGAFQTTNIQYQFCILILLALILIIIFLAVKRFNKIDIL